MNGLEHTCKRIVYNRLMESRSKDLIGIGSLNGIGRVVFISAESDCLI